MFFRLCTLAVLITVVVAAPPKARTRRDSPARQTHFLNFLSKNNKFPKDSDEYLRREANFQTSEQEVTKINAKAREKKMRGKKEPVLASINWTADLDDTEYEKLLGLKAFEKDL